MPSPCIWKLFREKVDLRKALSTPYFKLGCSTSYTSAVEAKHAVSLSRYMLYQAIHAHDPYHKIQVIRDIYDFYKSSFMEMKEKRRRDRAAETVVRHYKVRTKMS